MTILELASTLGALLSVVMLILIAHEEWRP